MGGTESKSSADIVNEIALSVTQESISRCVQTATQSQLIEVANVRKDVIIDGVAMKQGMSVNMQCAMSSEMQSDIQADIANQIAQHAETNGIALLSALGKTKSTTSTALKQIFSANVEQSTLQEEVMAALQKQEISVANVGGKVVIGDVSMDQTLEMAASAIISSSGYSKSLAKISSALEQATKATETGPFDKLFETIKGVVSSYVFLIIGVVVVGGLVMIFLMKYLFTTDTGAALVSSATDMAKAQLGGGECASLA